jgi:AraC family transcriptional regulator of adaptative response/methylated-DNA-[protein]-cysteine methyltransferase
MNIEKAAAAVAADSPVALPSADRMFEAFTHRDPSYDGVFFTGVRTTGIFCRPTCHARKPKRENIEFFPTAHEALVHGYRPCRVCHPLSPAGDMPEWVSAVVEGVHADPTNRLTDADLRRQGVDPVRLRRWFKSNLDMTFHDYCRSLRVGQALSAISQGDTATGAAFDAGYESLSGFGDAVKQLAGGPPSVVAAGAPIMLSSIPTPLGTMIAGATEEALALLEFTDRRGIDGQMKALRARARRPILTGRTAIHGRLEVELAEYFNGAREHFETPLLAPGTPFQIKVWDALVAIPYGETRSYAEQAARVGNPEAVRAVARANGANRIAILIPCHRVIGADGKLTGYGGGLWRKQRMLDLEAGRLRF